MGIFNFNNLPFWTGALSILLKINSDFDLGARRPRVHPGGD